MKKELKKIIIFVFMTMLFWIQHDYAHAQTLQSESIATQSNTDPHPKQTAAKEHGEPVLADPNRIIFEMKHNLDNSYYLPKPVKITLTLRENEQPRNNIQISLSDNLEGKIRVSGSAGTLFPGQPTVLSVEFIDKNLNKEKSNDSGNLEFYSAGELLCSIEISYFIDGIIDEHFTDDIERYSGERVSMGLSGPYYKRVGTVYLNKESIPSFTISFTPYILETDTTDNGLGIEPGNDSVKAVLLNPDGFFEFPDHTSSLEIAKGDEKITFHIQMKESAFAELKDKAQADPQSYIGSYILSDLVFEFKDGCLLGGKMSSLPLIYTVKASEGNQGQNSGGSSGGSSSGGSNSGGSSGGSSGGNSGGGSTSGDPGSGNNFADNEYNTTVNEDIGWRQMGDGSWFYLNAKGDHETGWLVNSLGVWYYLDREGKMVTGWAQINNIWYYFQPDGAMTTGWILLDNKWYYLNANGSMQTGWFKDSNQKWYYLYENGIMAENIWIDNYYVNDSGVWTESR